MPFFDEPHHPSAALHVVVVNNTYPPACSTPDELLRRYFLLTGWAGGLRSAGLCVTVMQRFHVDASVRHGNVSYHFIADRYGSQLRGWQLPWRLHQQVCASCRASLRAGHPTLVHMNGLLFPVATRHLRTILPPTCALVLQHHAERPWSGMRRHLQRWGLRSSDGFLFTNPQLAQGWVAARIISAQDQVFAVMECSSLLQYEARHSARAKSQMMGDPVLFWAGNLTANKDPLTILAGFEGVLAYRPAARLYMAFREAHLLDAIQQRLEQSQSLRHATVLLGAIPYEQIGDYFNSADLFVQGSAKEGSGIALLDALACGVIPVVTRIPAFQTITENGAVGALWTVGDATEFTHAVLRVLRQPLPVQSRKANALFKEHWSFPAIGQRAAQVYAEILQRRHV